MNFLGELVIALGTRTRRIGAVAALTPALFGAPDSANATNIAFSAPNAPNACPEFSFPKETIYGTKKIVSAPVQDGSTYYTNGVYSIKGFPERDHFRHDELRDLTRKFDMRMRAVSPGVVDVNVTAHAVKKVDIQLFRRELDGKTTPIATDLIKQKSFNTLRAGVPSKGIALCVFIKGKLTDDISFEYATPSFKVQTVSNRGAAQLRVNNEPQLHIGDVGIPGAKRIYLFDADTKSPSFLFTALADQVFHRGASKKEEYAPLNGRKAQPVSAQMEWHTDTPGLTFERTTLEPLGRELETGKPEALAHF